MLYKGSFIDQKGRAISLANSIMIIEGIKDKKSVGFNSSINSDNIFDENITYNDLSNKLNEKYQNALKRLAYEVSFDFDINQNNKRNVNDYLYYESDRCEDSYEKASVSYYYELTSDVIITYFNTYGAKITITEQ